MEKTVNGVMLREKKNIPRRSYKRKKRIVSKKLEKTKELIKEGYAPKKAAELAGYSKLTIKANMRKILENIRVDELIPHLRTLTAVGNLRAITTADEMLESDDPKWRAYGAKIITDNAKIHLAKRDTPTVISFSFQSNVQFNKFDDNKSRTIEVEVVGNKGSDE
jgi:hypothetical protein